MFRCCRPEQGSGPQPVFVQGQLVFDQETDVVAYPAPPAEADDCQRCEFQTLSAMMSARGLRSPAEQPLRRTTSPDDSSGGSRLPSSGSTAASESDRTYWRRPLRFVERAHMAPLGELSFEVGQTVSCDGHHNARIVKVSRWCEGATQKVVVNLPGLGDKEVSVDLLQLSNAPALDGKKWMDVSAPTMEEKASVMLRGFTEAAHAGIAVDRVDVATELLQQALFKMDRFFKTFTLRAAFGEPIEIPLTHVTALCRSEKFQTRYPQLSRLSAKCLSIEYDDSSAEGPVPGFVLYFRDTSLRDEFFHCLRLARKIAGGLAQRAPGEALSVQT